MMSDRPLVAEDPELDLVIVDDRDDIAAVVLVEAGKYYILRDDDIGRILEASDVPSCSWRCSGREGRLILIARVHVHTRARAVRGGDAVAVDVHVRGEVDGAARVAGSAFQAADVVDMPLSSLQVSEGDLLAAVQFLVSAKASRSPASR